MFVGQIVKTPYGEGIVNLIRDDKSVVVTPTSWELAAKQKPSFYLARSDASPVFSEGSAVKTSFGSGKITSIRAEDKQHIVHLDEWKLADGKSPTLYLNQDSLQRVAATEDVPTGESNERKHQEAKFMETFEKAMAHKATATEAYKNSDMEAAKQEYLSALQTLQYVSGELTNSHKAKLLEQVLQF